MIVKKLAIPLINEKILPQVEHCYIATASISEAAFDFVKSRLPLKCKMEIVTGMDGQTSPGVLKRVWRHYQDRISLKIYVKNFFHANVYIFDLPYRKSVAFIGSGDFTMGGVKDHEEIFYKVTDAKEIESLKSWFTGYYEFSEELTEDLIKTYEEAYPRIRQREIVSRKEKEQLVALTTRGFNWENIRFKNQYFKKEDYLSLSDSKAFLNTPAVQAERAAVRSKLLELHRLISHHLADLYLYASNDPDECVSSLDPADHHDHKLRAVWISYGPKGLTRIHHGAYGKTDNAMALQVVVMPKDIGVWLHLGEPMVNHEGRAYFKRQMEQPVYRDEFFKRVNELGTGYWIEVEGERKPVETFRDAEALWEFAKQDDSRYYAFIIGKNYQPGSADISLENIEATIKKDVDRLGILYKQLNDKVS